MSRLTMREVIEHCNRHTEAVERHSSRMQLEETPIGNSNFMKQYWEHRQVAEWLKELQAFKDKQEQGMLIELKVPLGTRIWYIEEDYHDNTFEISTTFYDFRWLYCHKDEEFYLTQAEAEEALERMKGE